jgi:hypothetical protein
MKIEFIQPQLSDKRQDSFWYNGQVATVSNGKRTISIEAIGELRIYLDEDGDLLCNDEARKEALRRNYRDVDVHTCAAWDGWVNSNWFALYDVENDEYLQEYDVIDRYDDALTLAKGVVDQLPEIKKRYKVWVHIEEIKGEIGSEEYRSLDDEYLPESAGEYDSIKEAVQVMQQISNTYSVHP